MIQPGDDLIRREEVAARGGQLDRQGQTVQPSADGGDSGRVRVVQREVGTARPGSLHEELDRFVGLDVVGRWHPGLGR